jgi:hypothetical protein
MTQKKIPNPPHSRHLLANSVALIDKKADEQKFRISFDFYNENLCEIDGLEISSAKKCLVKLKQIGRSTHKTLIENNVQPRPVHNSGAYKGLFSKLTADVSLFEIDIGKLAGCFTLFLVIYSM